MRFLVCVAGLANENKDGVLLFPLQASGFSSTVDSAEPGLPKRESGSDFQKVKITLAGILQDRPKAKIDVPELRHGSKFDAVQLARDEIIQRIRWYFPEAEIEGKQRFNVKRFAIKNDTKEPVTVWLHYRHKDRNEKGYEWVWKPGEPHAGEPLQLIIMPGETETVIDGDEQPIETSRVQIWAESESGDRWDEHRDDSLWLTEENPQLDGDRAYYAEKLATYQHVIRPHTGKRRFTERVVELQNATDEPLAVTLRYHTQTGGQFLWRTAEYDLNPGQRIAPRDLAGMRVRASRMHVTGLTGNRRYEKYSEEPLWLVDEVDGRRAYQAEAIGQFQFVFTPTGESAAGGSARVKVASTSIMSGTQAIGTLRQNTAVEVLDRRPGWVLIRAGTGAAALTGWVREGDLELSNAGAPPPPAEAARKTLTITAASANVQVGTTVIARLDRGDAYPVLEQRSGWCRIEFSLDGSTRQGWVDSRYGQLQ
jgi:hypothetical protein